MAEEFLVRVADLRAGPADSVLITLGLGSCVAILLHDPAAGVGGMAHVLLPSRSLSRTGENPGRFPQTAIPALLEAMTGLGAVPGRMVARLVGGAAMFAALAPSGSMQMGDRNLIASREVLRTLAIPIVGEMVGGAVGRSVWFHVGDGRVVVRAVGQSEQIL
ncbi:MAG: chemotaxis protein CheD [Gemmatimonadota bacterium]|nr:chemotaxis protein CheD [Gemmatimonadota bacterium]